MSGDNIAYYQSNVWVEAVIKSRRTTALSGLQSVFRQIVSNFARLIALFNKKLQNRQPKTFAFSKLQRDANLERIIGEADPCTDSYTTNCHWTLYCKHQSEFCLSEMRTITVIKRKYTECSYILVTISHRRLATIWNSARNLPHLCSCEFVSLHVF